MKNITINKHNFIDVSQLRIGLFVHLDLGWMDHPFATSNFKIKDAEQISKIMQLGLKRIRYDPKRSDYEPIPLVADTPVAVSTPQKTEDNTHMVEAIDPETTQEQRVQRLHQMHQAMNLCEKKFIEAGNTTKQVLKDISLQPKHSLEQAKQLVNEMVDSALTESEVAINAINGRHSNDSHFVHSLNVTVLSLMMARSLNMTEDDARHLGLACLFHDIGNASLSEKITLKKEPLTKSEQAYYEQHCELGARIAKEVGLPDIVVDIIMQHHECVNGTGYPKHLKAEFTHPLARLVSIINVYDNLCNPKDVALSKTPYEALAYMFAKQRSKYDDQFLQHLIKMLGVYPPGSIIQLSNGLYGVVVSVNPTNPLRPVVMLYDSRHVDKYLPLIVNLREEPNLSVSICLRPNQLPTDALNYLNPRKRISYFIDTAASTEVV